MGRDFYSGRKWVIMGFIAMVCGAFLVKLFFLQIIDSAYKERASKNVIRRITVHPARGLIYDRNGTLLVVNDPAYDLMVVPAQVAVEDTQLFCRLLGITKQQFEENLKKARSYSRYRPSVFLKQIPADVYSAFQEYNHFFRGFFGQVRNIRHYPYQCAAHILGYIGEISPEALQNSSYYQPGDYIGISGLELMYENQLRGKRGVKYVIVDVHNRVKGSYENGRYDTLAVSGKDLVSTLDVDLQVYGERLMQNKTGCIVAIEPATGEILAMVSSPAYDPNLLSGRDRGKNFELLKADSLFPLYNRPIMGIYPPGSTFKPLIALIGLQEQTLKPSDGFLCYGTYYFSGFSGGCHNHVSAQNVQQAIRHSCNGYFWNAFRRIIDKPEFGNCRRGLAIWRNYVVNFGFGSPTGIDLPNEKGGFIPDSSFYNRLYKGNHWRSATVISLGIGQGELAVTGLQLANMTAAIANRGWWKPPHLVKSIQGDTSGILSQYHRKYQTGIESRHFEPVIKGLEEVVLKGTATIARIDSITVCGKTGTAQNPHGDDHSLFIAFAPKENPRIAIAVIVENGGWGSSYAAPIASLMIEKYLKGKISPNRKWLEDRMLNADLIHEKIAMQ